MEYKISDSPVEYREAISFMEDRVMKISNGDTDEMIWLLEHPSIYTAGLGSSDSEILDKNKFPIYKTGRGGKLTYHGPGQKIVYIMLNLKARQGKIDLRKYISVLGEWIVTIISELGIKSYFNKDRIGVWIKNPTQENKIAAIGIRVRKWITYHGIALNVNVNLNDFSGIIPCGINNYGITSIHKYVPSIEMKVIDDLIFKTLDKAFCEF